MSDPQIQRISTEDVSSTTPNDTSKGGLTGWAATEDYMLKHDVGMVKDFADDVDTLLVFAGLFSAVLTAFVVESYQLLQADNAENTVRLLVRISAQLESCTLNAGFINSTRPALPPPSFTPNHTALWINVLWFLSLLFSLSAALFGILVKQWLREYMQWNSALASPKENVLVRQIRFEAWNEWNMAASISCIPALLEVALILFVCGLVVLLWTLDPIVALVITIAAAIFLMIVSSLTLLPAFFKRCPYKSPTAWACVILWEFMRDAALFLINFVKAAFTSDAIRSKRLAWRLEHWHMPARHWRDRDIAGVRPSHFRDLQGRNRDALAVVHEELAGEWVALDDKEGRGYVVKLNLGGIRFSAAYQALASLGELSTLFRALSWVSKASEGVQVHKHVLPCADSIHSAIALIQSTGTELMEVLGVNGVRNLSTWYLLSRIWEGKRPNSTEDVEDADSLLVLTSLRRTIRRGYHAIPFVLDGWEQHPVVRYYSNWPLMEVKPRSLRWRYSTPDTQVITHILASSIRITVEEMLSEWYWYEEHLVHGRRAIELLCALRFVLRANASLPDFTPTCASTLVQTYNLIHQSPRGKDFDSTFPGIRYAILEFICRFAAVDVEGRGQLQVISVGRQQLTSPMDATAYATLALHLPTAGNREDLHIFVQVVQRCLVALILETVPTELTQHLLEKMCSVAQECLENRYWNCGSYGDLPWLRTLHYDPMLVLEDTDAGLFSRLMDLLDQSCQAGLLTGGAEEDLDALRSGRRRGHLIGTFNKELESIEGPDGLVLPTDATSP